MATKIQGDSNAPLTEEPKIPPRDKNVSWYREKLKGLSPVAREMLENYSKIPPGEVESHVYKIRDEAWDVFPYPCIGEFRFLDLAITTSPSYPSILNRLKTGRETFLDLGCCFGQELRKVAYDGAVQENLYGSDLRSEFFEMGYRLFRDRDTLKSRFIQADIFDDASALFTPELHGKIDIIYAASFLHLFGYEQQVEVCKRLVGISRGKEGSMVVGRQVGSSREGEYVQKTNAGGSMYRHSAGSFERMWERVGEETGTKWRVECELKAFEWLSEDEREEREKMEPGLGMLRFSVIRE
ncbi:hypothetical protein ONS95_001178 [Cadophora gregata]|uniref:uncharacterized protein n=1 Tax=Cadophora gregata TaxID=51156 RepID=UPI0026DC7749|nr:uncharacterized protein ONS95_001178 [Cadophora gregata]KAK0102016.1 hypothetical protein ONS96_005984 [Cadophora gregata f. sp. sojae]KAK0129242.1 hypothetical protein ONS95_001178 [Cadophora gregata]